MLMMTRAQQDSCVAMRFTMVGRDFGEGRSIVTRQKGKCMNIVQDSRKQDSWLAVSYDYKQRFW